MGSWAAIPQDHRLLAQPEYLVQLVTDIDCQTPCAVRVWII